MFEHFENGEVELHKNYEVFYKLLFTEIVMLLSYGYALVTLPPKHIGTDIYWHRGDEDDSKK